jgi:hypothetical protein
MQLQTTVGAPSSSQAPGQQPNLRAGAMSDLIVSEFMGRYAESTYRRQNFSAATQAALATTAGLATAYTGLILSNPVGSGVNLHLNKVGYASIVAQATALAVGIMVGFNAGTNVTHTTPAAPKSNFVGVGVAGVGLVDTAATMPTAPTLQALLGSIDTGAVTTVTVSGLTVVDLESSIILPPGAYAALYTSAASAAASLLASIGWQELPA